MACIRALRGGLYASGTVSTLMSVYLPVAVPELKGAAVTQAELG